MNNIDEYIDKLQRSTDIHINLDWIRKYIKMNCPEGSEGRDYILAMLETWRVDVSEKEKRNRDIIIDILKDK